jgi:hypothetical protein
LLTQRFPRAGAGKRSPEYVENLPASAYVLCAWLRNPEHHVWVHTVISSVKSLYRRHLIVIRQHLDDPLNAARFWASSDLKADIEQLLAHISARWNIYVFKEGMKELFTKQERCFTRLFFKTSRMTRSPFR